MSKFERLKNNYKASLKSMDTEETFDLIFYRPIGYCWAVLAKKLGIKPNAITITSIFLGIGSGFCFYFNNIWWNLLGVFLLVWADSFDSADGQLARMTRQYSRIGRILDGISSQLWFAAIYVAICLRENHSGGHLFETHHWVIWIVAVATAICHAIQAEMADYYRQFHLFFVKGKDGAELELAQDLWDRFHALSWKDNFFQKLAMLFYANYTTGQEKRTPWMQKFRRLLRDKYNDRIPLELREKFRAQSRPLMKYTNILSFNTRTFALFAAVLIFRMPWLYFAFELSVLNVVMIYMMWRHENICRKIYFELKNG